MESPRGTSDCRRDSTGADWFVCHRGTIGCPRVHDSVTPHCRECETHSCSWGHEPPHPAGVPVEDWCALHPEDRERLMGSTR